MAKPQRDQEAAPRSFINNGIVRSGHMQRLMELTSTAETVDALPREVIHNDRYPLLVQNSCLHAFFLHARTLSEFLRNSATRGTDVRANQIVPGFTLSEHLLEPLKTLFNEASAQLAHVTIKRVGDGTGAVPPVDVDTSPEGLERIRKLILEAWDEFAALAGYTTSDRFSLWFEPNGELTTEDDLRARGIHPDQVGDLLGP